MGEFAPGARWIDAPEQGYCKASHFRDILYILFVIMWRDRISIDAPVLLIYRWYYCCQCIADADAGHVAMETSSL